MDYLLQYERDSMYTMTGGTLNTFGSPTNEMTMNKYKK